MAKHRRLRTFKPGRRENPSPLRGAALRLSVEGLSHDGRGIARLKNKVVFVDGALPGEEVDATLQRQQRRYDEAKMDACLSPSPARVTPFCPLYERCGGCQLQHLDIEAQRVHKRRRLVDVLGENERFSVDGLEMLAGPSRAYRHRVRLSYRGGSLGFRARSSHEIIDIPQCPVMNDSLNRALEIVRPVLLDYLRNAGPCELALASGERGEVGLSIRQTARVSLRRSQELADRLSPNVRLHLISSGNGIWHGPGGELRYPVPLGTGLAFRAGDFTQANPCINALILHRVGRWLSPRRGEPVVDYFCGLGNFSHHLTLLGASVTGYDIGEAMIGRADRAARALGSDTDFNVADLFDPRQLSLPGNAQKAILDPPRAGAAALCEFLARQLQLRTLVYVSCEPASLARDLDILRRGGMQVVSILAADMFPHTQHLEALVLLRRC